MQTRQRAGMGLVIGIICCVAYLRAPRTDGFKSVGEAVLQPISVSMGILHRLRLLNEDGQGVPHCKVSWCAAGLPMAGGLSDLHGQFELRAPRDFIGPGCWRQTWQMICRRTIPLHHARSTDTFAPLQHSLVERGPVGTGHLQRVRGAPLQTRIG